MVKKNNNLAEYLFHEGTNFHAFDYMGAHRVGSSFVFRTWAPNADVVYLCGDFNNWDKSLPMKRTTKGGIWEVTLPSSVSFGENSKYKFITERDGSSYYKADPYAFFSETQSHTASIYYDLEGYKWHDGAYLKKRAALSEYLSRDEVPPKPMNIYEVHLGSWKRHADGSYYTYRELADELSDYAKNMGYTHIEVLPVAEHPYDGSWGYQACGYYAPTSRFGTPHDFMYFVDTFHKKGLGVILDWVPAHFPKDAHGLYEFDGGPCYEYQGEDRREHRSWGTRIFDVGRNEVQSFLISNAVFWLEKYHIDGLRVDAVASMLYLDYDRKPGEWFPNEDGTNINRQSVAFFKTLNATVKEYFPDALMIAEESTAYPEITYKSGLGFSFKWNMGWMNDTLSYVETDSYFRSGCHHKMTFSIVYAFGESYILPISHDEVVHGKKSLIDKMFGPYENKFPQLRTYLAFMMAHPGKKLLFMGCEFAQFREWDFENSLEWFMLDYPKHKETQDYVRALNHFYLSHPALWERDRDYGGFRWLDADRCGDNTYIFERYDLKGNRVVCVFNFSPNEYRSYGIPAEKGAYTEIFNTDKPCYGGSGCDNPTRLTAKKAENGGFFLKINVPAFGACFFRYTKPRTSNKKQEGIKGHD